MAKRKSKTAKRSGKVVRKGRGRPLGARDRKPRKIFNPRPKLVVLTKINTAFRAHQVEAIDAWREKQDPVPGRSEAIRLLVGHALVGLIPPERFHAMTLDDDAAAS